MRSLTRVLLASGLAAGLAACAAAPAPAAAPTSRAAAPSPAPPRWTRDDYAASRAHAAATGKILLVDAWAPWCHTCLSMQAEVLERPEIGRFSDRVAFVAIDTDRPENAPLLERFAVEVWPTFLLLDPRDEHVLGVHGGAASVEELERVIEGALALRAAAAPAPFEEALGEAAAAFAARRFADAARAYARAASLPHPRASEAWLGAARALHELPGSDECAEVAEGGIDRVRGAAMAADFTFYARACAAKLADGPRREAIERRALARLREITADPPPGASVDDRADALGMLAEAERAAGNEAEARSATRARVELLERAAAAARSPHEAAVFDYLRLRAYEDDGRPEAAIAMLEERTRQLPTSYEAHARLASALAKVDPRRAMGPLRRAIALSYGPRRLRYLEQEAELLGAIGDLPGRAAALERLVAAHASMPPGHADPAGRARAEAALEAARGALAAPR